MANDHAAEKELGMETWMNVSAEFWRQFGDAAMTSGVLWGAVFGLPLSLWGYLKLTRRWSADWRNKPLWVLGAVAVISVYVAAVPLLLHSGLRVIGH